MLSAVRSKRYQTVLQYYENLKSFENGMFAFFLYSWPRFMLILRYADNGLRCQMCLFHPSHCPLLNLYWVGLCIGPVTIGSCWMNIMSHFESFRWSCRELLPIASSQVMNNIHCIQQIFWSETWTFIIHIRTHDRLQRIFNRSYHGCFIWPIFCVTVLRRFVFSPCSAP